MRKDFDCGLVSKRDSRWRLAASRQQGNKERIYDKEDKKDEELYELNKNIMVLVATNMAIDVMDEVKDKKEVVKNLRAYLPKDQWNSGHPLLPSLEKFMAVKLLRPKCENYVEKLLKAEGYIFCIIISPRFLRRPNNHYF